MLSLLTGLKQTQTKSVLGLRTALSSQSSSVTQLLQTNLIHQHYVNVEGGLHGRFGFPSADVQFLDAKAIREYRGGEIQILGGKVQSLPRHEVEVRLLGIRCVREADHDQSTPHDEPYFIITVDTGNGAPVVKKFGPFEGVDTDTELGEVALLLTKAPPNPMGIRVLAYENDAGDPDATAKKIQEEAIKISQQVGALASAAGAASGPGADVVAGAGTVGTILSGPIGGLLAAGAVLLFGEGDDFIGQSATFLFGRSDDVRTPLPQGRFQNNDFNMKINVNGREQGEYDLFFDIHVQLFKPPVTV